MKQLIITVVGLNQRTLDTYPCNYVNLILAIVQDLCVCVRARVRARVRACARACACARARVCVRVCACA